LGDKDTLNKYGISAGYLFYPAQFWAHKNHINLLLALNLLREKHGLALNMIFVGSNYGNEEYVRQKIEELNIASQVKILGFVPQSDLIALYRQALALTYVTFFGPDNLPPLEAFALECPVIASSVPGAQEQLGDSALLVDPADPEDIALAIRKICEDSKLRATLIQRGKKRAAEWTGDDFVRGVFGILDEFEPFRRSWR
jgi:glycosyltransferase involved in cell wall biosynthesis